MIDITCFFYVKNNNGGTTRGILSPALQNRFILVKHRNLTDKDTRVIINHPVSDTQLRDAIELMKKYNPKISLRDIVSKLEVLAQTGGFSSKNNSKR